MALHLTPEEHDANPPHTWEVVKNKRGRRWSLYQRGQVAAGTPLGDFNTKREAVAAKSSGFYFDLYNKEGRWFRGERVDGWKPYVPKPTLGGTCPTCGKANPIVNACGCDPNNMPTRPLDDPPQEVFDMLAAAIGHRAVNDPKA